MRRLLIIGSQTFAAEAMRVGLRHAIGLNVFAVIDASTDVAAEIRRVRPDIIVVDGVTEGRRAVHSLSQIRAQAEHALMLVVLDATSPEDRARVLDAGAVIWTWAGASIRVGGPRRASAGVGRLPVAGRSALATSRPAAVLTSRELETLGWVAEGHTNAWIARRLWVTEQTVKFHLTNTYRKLGVANRTEAGRYAMRHGLVPSGGDVAAAEAEAEAPVADVRAADTSMVRG